MYTHFEAIPSGARFKSALTGTVYVVMEDYDPTDIKHNAIIKLAPRDYPAQVFGICADRIGKDFVQ